MEIEKETIQAGTPIPTPIRSPKKTNVRMIVGMGLLTAIVVVLQMLASQIKFGPFSITLCLAPIAVGAALYGRLSGAWLGFVFSMVVMFTDTALFMAINPMGTIITVILKGTLAGLAAGIIYKPLSKKSDLLATLVSCVVVPLVNKLVFVGGCALFFYDTMVEWAAGAGASNVVFYMFIGMTGLNFPVELAVNLILSAAIVRIVQMGRKQLV